MARERDRAKMELGATMELFGGRGPSTLEKKTPFYSGGTIPTVTHHSARDPRYYRTTGAVLPHGPAVLPRRTAVLPWARQSPDLSKRARTGHGRSAGAVLPQVSHRPGPVGIDVKNYIRDYFR